MQSGVLDELVAPLPTKDYHVRSMDNEEKTSKLAEQQFQLWVKLESIFMPHSRKQRDDAYKRQPGSGDAPPADVQLRCAHYTSAESALSIIKSKRIWMRNTTCMSDYREVQHGFEILLKFFSDKSKKDAFIAALDSCAPGVALEAINLFDQWLNDIKFNTYIASMSEHDSKENFHGRLSMWRAFGGATPHVAIVFRVPWHSGAAQALNLIFSPVAYLTENEAHADLFKVMENIGKNCEFLRSVERQVIVSIVFNMLLAGVTSQKHEGFGEEREWRAIYSPKRVPSDLMESSTEIIGGVPQLVYKLPLDASASPVLADLDFAQLFERLIIGPSPYPWAMYEAFVAALAKVGVQDAEKKVCVSGIPIRS